MLDVEEKTTDFEAEHSNAYLYRQLTEAEVVLKKPPVGASLPQRALYVYDQLALWANAKVVSSPWFEGFVMVTIVAVGVGIGMGLSGLEENDSVAKNVLFGIDMFSFWVFLFEAAVKIFACGSRPWVYFLSKSDGSFNCFDFTLVVIALVFSPFFGASADVSNVKVLRLMRLLRLLNFLKFVPEVRVMIEGLVSAMDSVGYILLLLCLVVYIFAVLGVLLFGENDPANFNDVSTAMVTLFQTATLTNWASVALISFHGCDKFAGNGYVFGVEDPLPSGVARTQKDMLGIEFPMWSCTDPGPKRLVTYFYFITFTIMAAMVVMSLFIGVIAIGMFTEYQKYQDEKVKQKYDMALVNVAGELEKPDSVLRMALDFTMGIENPHVEQTLVVQQSGVETIFRMRSKDDEDEKEGWLFRNKEKFFSFGSASIPVSFSGGGAPSEEVSDKSPKRRGSDKSPKRRGSLSRQLASADDFFKKLKMRTAACCILFFGCA